MSRPGAALLVSLVAAGRRGRPGPARDAALAAAEGDPGAAAEYLLDAVYASLQAGEPRYAIELLDRLEDGGPTGGIRRRALACRAWAAQLDRNWYPGDLGAEVSVGTAESIPSAPEVAPGDPETILVEACVAHGPVPLFTARWLIASMLRTAPAAVPQMLGSQLGELEKFKSVAEDAGATSAVVWATVAQADLSRRAGLTDEPHRFLSAARDACRQLGDPIGEAGTWLVEGDWWATPGSSPEALGLYLEAAAPSPLADQRDDSEADAAYARAADRLAALDAPLAAGALALRRAALAWRRGAFVDQVRLLDEASRAFAAAGDQAGLCLVRVHRLLADLAAGQVATTLMAAGTGWDLQPRGPVAEILSWATERGSVSFCAGLGRLLERAGARWVDAGDLDRAAAAWSLSLPLISASGAVAPAAILTALADLDDRRDLPARALVRLEQASSAVSIPAEIGDRPERWMQVCDLVMSIVRSQANRVGSSSASVTGLERALQRLKALAAVPGVPLENVSARLLREKDELLEKLSRAHESDTLEEIQADATVMMTPQVQSMLAMAAQSVREQIAVNESAVALHRARLAQRTGWEVEADRWFQAALDGIDAEGASHRWLGVVACAVWGRLEEARARFDAVRLSGALPDDLLASLALRAGAPEAARSLFERLDDSSTAIDGGWRGLADRAEAALETGDPEAALELAATAIEAFEEGIGRLARDPDRIAACDDIGAAFMFMVAARACLAIADRAAATDQARREALSRALELSDRGRAFALLTLVARPAEGAAELPRRWQQAATEWSAGFERVLNAYERRGGEGVEELLSELARAEGELGRIEADLETSQSRLLAARRTARPPAIGNLHRHLPEGVCLLSYHLVGRDLLVTGVSADQIDVHHRRLGGLVVEALVNRFLRSTAAGTPGAEAAELAALLLDPVAGILERNERVVVVPFGALHALPLHALPFGADALGESHVLSYLPAASLIERFAVDAPLRGTGALVVGDPAFDRTARPALRRLPGAAVEARAVAGLLGSDDVLIDADAREDRLRTLLADRPIVHLAAHGVLDEIAPSTSSIVLAGADELTVADLIGLRIDAELAVLSACDTGRGNATLGGDVVGLVRGLLSAGVRRSVVSLWPVDDVAACVTMATFYERLAAAPAPPPARALADAQRTVRRMSAEQIVERYRELGGDVGEGAGSRPRAAGAPAVVPAPPTIALDPEFIDSDEPADEPVDALDGSLTRVWAPFILVGA